MFQKKGGFKKYSAAQKSAYYAKKGVRKATSYLSKKGVAKARNYPKMKFGLVRTVESIVRSMGPPRNVSAFAQGLVTAAQSTQALRNGLCLISLTAQNQANINIGGNAAGNGAFVGVFPNSAAGDFQGGITLNKATTNEYYMKKMKTRVILQPKFVTLTQVAGEPPTQTGNLTAQPLQGFRVIFFAQRRDLDSAGQTQNGLITGYGSVSADILERYGAPTVYTQLFNPQFFTHFKVLSDKVHRVFNPVIWDGSPLTAPLSQLVTPASGVDHMSNLMLDFNTYVNKKLVNVQVNGAAQLNSADYPQNFPATSKTYVLILPVMGTLTSANGYTVQDGAQLPVSYNISTQTYAHFRDI